MIKGGLTRRALGDKYDATEFDCLYNLQSKVRFVTHVEDICTGSVGLAGRTAA